MYRYIQYFKKVLNLQPAFIIAVILHAALLISFGPKELVSTTNSSRKSIIPVQFGSESKSSLKKNSISDIHGPTTRAMKNTEIDPVELGVGAEAEGVNGNATGNGNGATNENGFAFEDSILKFSEPHYPIVALKREIEGRLRVRIKVSDDGIPLETIILSTSNHKMLDEAALKVIPLWRFQKRSGFSFYFVERTFVFKIKR